MKKEIFDAWNILKQYLDSKEYVLEDKYFEEREIWFMSWGLNIGVEELGKHEQFERPALILKKFNEKMMYAIPLTTQASSHKYRIAYNLDEKKFAAKINQMRLVDSKRLLRRIAILDNEQFQNIRSGLKSIL